MKEYKISWQHDFFIDGDLPPDEFMKRFEMLLSLDKTGIINRVKSKDLWVIVATALAANDGVKGI